MSSNDFAAAFRAASLYPVVRGEDSFEASLTLRGETYYGFSNLSREHALRDLAEDLPEDFELRIKGKAGMLA